MRQLLCRCQKNATYFSMNKIFSSVTVSLGSLYSKKQVLQIRNHWIRIQ
jgi:hypothetical protein